MVLSKAGILEKFQNCKIIYFYIFNFLRNTWTHYPGVPAHCIEVDKSHSVLYSGHDNGYIGVINLNKNQVGQKIKGHEGSVNAMGINLTNTNLYTLGSDGVLNIWQ